MHDSAKHDAFFVSLQIKPDITICVFGYMVDQEKTQDDWKEAERTIQVNYTGLYRF